MSYQFSGCLYPNLKSWALAFASEWISAGGANDAETINEMFREYTDQEILEEMQEWIGEDDDEAALLDAIDDMRNDRDLFV